MEWIESQINNEAIFPVTTDVPFPKTFGAVCKKILTRLYRVFVHVYVHHFDRLMQIGAEPHVNTCYKHFYYFVTEFSLMHDKVINGKLDIKSYNSRGHVKIVLGIIITNYQYLMHFRSLSLSRK